MIKVITFDLDDTLWDAKPVLESAERAVYQWLGSTCPAATTTHSLLSLRTLRTELANSRPDLAHQITEIRRLALQTVLQQAGLDPREATNKADEGIAVFLEARHKVQLYPVVKPMLAELAAEFTLVALTNGNADIFRTPVGRYFTFAYSAEALDSSKPQAAHFERTEQRTGATPDQILHVGDHIEHDIQAASARGWQTIWLNQNRCADRAQNLQDIQPRQARRNQASAVGATAVPATTTVEDINELPEAIRRLVRAS